MLLTHSLTLTGISFARDQDLAQLLFFSHSLNSLSQQQTTTRFVFLEANFVMPAMIIFDAEN